MIFFCNSYEKLLYLYKIDLTKYIRFEFNQFLKLKKLKKDGNLVVVTVLDYRYNGLDPIIGKVELVQHLILVNKLENNIA